MLSTSDEQFYLSSPSLPAAVIQQAVWLYFAFLSLRDVEDMLSQRGIGLGLDLGQLPFPPKLCRFLAISRDSGRCLA